MKESKIEKMICSEEFNYDQPYFYHNPYALRCKLGMGENDGEYISNANKRAIELYHILFEKSPDAIMFDYWIADYSSNGKAEEGNEQSIDYSVQMEADKLRFVLQCQNDYRHKVVKNLETFDDLPEKESRIILRNRIVCYLDDKQFDFEGMIKQLIDGSCACYPSFVSFENECIYSIYDDRGCDIVFATREKMKEFYEKIEPYFLECDIEEMRKRVEG